jgi:hypothetical protein
MAEGTLRAVIVEKVENYFNENGWNNYEYDERYCIFKAGVGLHCKLKRTDMRVHCLDVGITFHFPISIGTDDENEIQTMEFITRANYGLRYGGFQMNLDNNSIEYMVFVPCEDEPTMAAINTALRTGLSMLERYGDELLAVMFGMKNAKDAVEAVER